jgi:hypothetical protein
MHSSGLWKGNIRHKINGINEIVPGSSPVTAVSTSFDVAMAALLRTAGVLIHVHSYVSASVGPASSALAESLPSRNTVAGAEPYART